MAVKEGKMYWTEFKKLYNTQKFIFLLIQYLIYTPDTH